MGSYTRMLSIVAVMILLGAGGAYYGKNFRGWGPAVLPPAEDITALVPPSQPLPSLSDNEATVDDAPAPPVNTTDMPLLLPDGFSVSIFANDLTTPRAMAFDAQGNLWVSEMNAGAVTMIEIRDGAAQGQARVFQHLKRPHGLAFDPADPSMLYVAEEDAISRTRAGSGGALEKIIDLPAGGRHFSRTIGFGPDERLYAAIGSSCDVCREDDERRAAIYSLQRDGSDFKLFAKGLRNTVFFGWHPVTGALWGTDMGRDRLGGDLPPDEINIITEGGNYGWPVCYGKNAHDTAFDANTYIRNPCMEPFETPSHIDLPAHSAPLGLAFIPAEAGWPQEYAHDLLVAYHGSWNRSTPTGYKVVRIRLSASGDYEGTEDFLIGWLQMAGAPRFAGEAGALGRPVGLAFDAHGALYISDDKAGVVYRAHFTPS